MKKRIIKILLRVLNSNWLNGTPCSYGFVGNVDNFSYENLASEEKQQPGITVKQVLETADRFKSCPIGKGLTVIEPDGSTREATAWDLHELQRSFDREGR
jgi:hypothetical protein